jgi:S-adenosylmethionine hydrolase
MVEIEAVHDRNGGTLRLRRYKNVQRTPTILAIMANLTARPIITLTTDFGLSDHYAGTMKSVIAGICPDAQVIDITHQIAPADIISGAYAIAQTAAYSPPGTIHVVVIDPGVGTARKAIAVRSNGQTFVAPDNGVLSLAVPKGTGAARELTKASLFLPKISNTFHGRDIFAPSAAHLAAGDVAWEDIGPELRDVVAMPDLMPIREREARWRGIVLSIDHFGNVITNFPKALVVAEKKTFTIATKHQVIHRVQDTFGETTGSDIFAYIGSSGYLELAINRGSAATALGVKPGDTVTLDLHA